MSARELEQMIRELYAERAPGQGDEGEALARYVAGDMDDAEESQFESLVANSPEMQNDLYEFEASRAAWDEAGVTKAPWWQRLWKPTVGAAFAVSAATALLLLVPMFQEEADPDRLQPKGSWELHVAAEHDGKVVNVETTLLVEGDRLGFFYSSATDAHLMILYADQTGSVTRIFPANRERSAAIVTGQRVRIGDGAQLGEAAECEWLVGLLGRRPFDTREATDLLQARVRARDGCRLGAGEGDLEARVVRVRRK